MRICVYCADVAGMHRQARGLADVVAGLGGAAAEVVEVRAKDSGFAKLLPQVASYFAPVVEPAPDIFIACGGAAVAGALRAKREGVFVVYVQKPPLTPRAFDVVVCGAHDNLCGDNVVAVVGAVGGVNAAVIARRKQQAEQRFAKFARPRTALLIGGDSRAYSLTPELCRRLIKEVKVAAGDGSVLATASRRTSDECRKVLQDESGDNFFYDFPTPALPGGKGEEGDSPAPAGEDNPYLDILAAADRAAVTCDSVNMISEACSAGAPVYVLPLDVINESAARKFEDFHGTLTRRGAVKMFGGTFDDWQCAPLNETARAAEFVWQRYQAARDGDTITPQ